MSVQPLLAMRDRLQSDVRDMSGRSSRGRTDSFEWRTRDARASGGQTVRR
jgi:hypothetical protein